MQVVVDRGVCITSMQGSELLAETFFVILERSIVVRWIRVRNQSTDTATPAQGRRVVHAQA